MDKCAKSVGFVLRFIFAFIFILTVSHANARTIFKSCENAYKYLGYGTGAYQTAKKFTRYPVGFPAAPAGSTWCDATTSLQKNGGDNRYINAGSPDDIKGYYTKAFKKAGYGTTLRCGIFKNYMLYFRTPGGSGGFVSIGSRGSTLAVKFYDRFRTLDKVKGRQCS